MGKNWELVYPGERTGCIGPVYVFEKWNVSENPEKDFRAWHISNDNGFLKDGAAKEVLRIWNSIRKILSNL